MAHRIGSAWIRALCIASACVALACGSDSPHGTLNIAISGLPAGVDADVTVSGANLQQHLTASQPLWLPGGAWSATARPVSSGAHQLLPTVTGSPATLLPGSSTTISILYAEQIALPATGTLHVAISGLPGGVDAGVRIAGPAGFAQSLTATATLSSLAVGDYAAAAVNVVSGSSTYVATVTGSPASVTAGATASIGVAYALANGRLEVDISFSDNSQGDGAVTVSGPGGFSQSLTGTTTLTHLPPGAYTVVAAEVGSSPHYIAIVTGSPAAVVNGAKATVDVEYTRATGSLQVSMLGLPDGGAPGNQTAAWVVGGSLRVNLIKDTLLSNLDVGPYTITGVNVDDASGRYMYRVQSYAPVVAVAAGQTANATVTFAPDFATLIVNTTGGDPVKSDLDVQGADESSGFDALVKTASATLQVGPGLYFMFSRPYTVGSTVFNPSVDVPIFPLHAGDTRTVNVTFDGGPPTVSQLWLESDAGSIISKDQTVMTGQRLGVLGSGFLDAGTQVNFDGTPLAVPFAYSAWGAREFFAPPHEPGIVQVSVTTDAGTSNAVPLNYFAVDGHALPDAGNNTSIRAEGSLVMGPDGNPWLVERSAGAIVTYAIDAGTFSTYALAPSSEPVDLVSGADGELWFTDAAHPVLGSITPGGIISLHAIPSGCTSYGLVSGQQGKIWFTENCTPPRTNAIGLVDPAHPDAIVEMPIPTTALLRGIAQAPDGALYVAEGQQNSSPYAVSILSPAGQYLNHPLAQEPQFLALSATGEIWLLGEEISTIAPNGVDTHLFAGNNIDLGCRIAADADGIWYTGNSGVTFYSSGLQRPLTFAASSSNLPTSGIASGGHADAWIYQVSPAALLHLRR